MRSHVCSTTTVFLPCPLPKTKTNRSRGEKWLLALLALLAPVQAAVAVDRGLMCRAPAAGCKHSAAHVPLVSHTALPCAGETVQGSQREHSTGLFHPNSLTTLSCIVSVSTAQEKRRVHHAVRAVCGGVVFFIT